MKRRTGPLALSADTQVYEEQRTKLLDHQLALALQAVDATARRLALRARDLGHEAAKRAPSAVLLRSDLTALFEDAESLARRALRITERMESEQRGASS